MAPRRRCQQLLQYQPWATASIPLYLDQNIYDRDPRSARIQYVRIPPTIMYVSLRYRTTPPNPQKQARSVSQIPTPLPAEQPSQVARTKLPPPTPALCLAPEPASRRGLMQGLAAPGRRSPALCLAASLRSTLQCIDRTASGSGLQATRETKYSTARHYARIRFVLRKSRCGR